LRLKGVFDDSKSRFVESVKALMQKIQSQVFAVHGQKIEIMKKFDTNMNSLEKDAENDSLELLRLYLKKKKHVDRAIERDATEVDWQSQIDGVITYLDTLDYDLMVIEMNLSKSIQKVYDELIDIRLKGIFMELENAATGDAGLNQMSDIFTDFFTKFTEEAQEEAERIDKAHEGDEKMQDGNDYNDDLDDKNLDIGILENLDDLKSNIAGIRDAVEARQRNIETEIRNKINVEKGEYMKNSQLRMNEKNRKNVQNIIKFIGGEKLYWENKKNVQIEDDDDDDN